MNIQFGQIRLLVDDMAASVRFYRDVLGLKLVSGDEDDAYNAFHSDGSDVELALFLRTLQAEAMGIAMPAPSGDSCVLNVVVDDVDAAYASLQTQGIAFVTPPTDRPAWGLRTAHLRDPQGYLIELSQGLKVVTE